jgi:hypothetical protein
MRNDAASAGFISLPAWAITDPTFGPKASSPGSSALFFKALRGTPVTIKSIVIPAVFALAVAGGLAPAPVQASCLKGAVVGGAVGHLAGHHALLGAGVGCLMGRHEANRDYQDRYDNHGWDNGRH